MLTAQMLRGFIAQTVAAAVDEICSLCEKTLLEYEQEVCRLKEENGRLLSTTTDLQQLSVPEEEVSSVKQEWSPSLVQEESEPPHIKEEEEGLRSQTEEASSSVEEMKIEADGDDCGLSEPAGNLDPAADLQPTSDGQLLSSHCCETDTEDSEDDRMETRESQSGLYKMKNDKILVDIQTILSLDNRSLRRFLPALGDHVAIKGLCGGKQPKHPAHRKQQDLLETLQERMRLSWRNRSLDAWCQDRKRKSVGNTNAKKSSRCIELGWIHNCKQVRSKNGGGTHKLSVAKETDYETLLQLGKNIFFPDGRSNRGAVEDFTFKIWDFRRNEMPLNTTVGAIYERRNTGMLRFYLASFAKEEPGICNTDDD